MKFSAHCGPNAILGNWESKSEQGMVSVLKNVLSQRLTWVLINFAPDGEGNLFFSKWARDLKVKQKLLRTEEGKVQILTTTLFPLAFL